MRPITHIVLNNFTNDSRVLKETTTLANAGYHVTVVALHEKSLLEHEIIDKITVRRINLFTRKYIKKRYFTFLKYFEFIVRFLIGSPQAEIIHCHDLGTLPIGVLAKIFWKNKPIIIYDAHEYEIGRSNLSFLTKKINFLVEKSLIRYASKIITVSSSIAKEYKKSYNFIKKPYIILNCPTYKDVKNNNLLRNELGISKDKTIFLYQGGLSKGRGIEVLLDAFQQIQNDQDVIVFMGYGPLENKIQTIAKTAKNIFFKPAVSQKILLNYTASADYGIIFYENNCLNHKFCLPNKVFEYAMANLPIIASNLFELTQFIKTSQVGVSAETNDSQGLLRAIKKIKSMDRDQLKKNIKIVSKKYNWEAQEDLLLEIYNGN